MSEKKERKIQEEEWYEYDENGNYIYFKNSGGYESWYDYDENGNKTHRKDSNGYEEWYEYDKNNNLIHKITVINIIGGL